MSLVAAELGPDRYTRVQALLASSCETPRQADGLPDAPPASGREGGGSLGAGPRRRGEFSARA